MTCITCGAELDSTSTTCTACGEPVPTSVGATSVLGETASSYEAADRTGVGDAGDGPEEPWEGDGGRDGESGGHGGQGGGRGGDRPRGHDGAGGPPPPGAGGGGSVPPYGGGQAWGAPPPHPSGLSSEVRGWGIGAHLGGLVLGLATAATLGFLAPMLVWLLKREEHPFIDHHGKEALNFQLTVLLAVVAGAVLAIPGAIVGVLTLGIGLVLLAVLGLAAMVLWIVFPIMGAVKAANGEGFRYPLTIRFVR